MAVAAIVVSFVLRFSLVDYLGMELPTFITLFPALMVAALLGGLWPGLLATGLGLLGTDYLVLAPRGHLAISSPSDAFALGLFAVMGIFMSLIAEDYRRSQRLNADYEAKKAKSETEALYRNLFNSMDEGFCVIEVLFNEEQKPTDWRFLEVNAAYEKQTRIPNPIGKTMREIAPDLEEYWFDVYGKVALTGEAAHVLNEAKAIDGFYEVRAYRVGEPELRHVAVVFSEISGRMREERALREQAELIDLAHDTIMVQDMDGTIRFWNHGAEEMYGFSSEEAVGRKSHELLKTVSPQPLAELERQVLEDGRWDGELIHTGKDGARLVVASRWALQRDNDGQPSGVLEINNDISERKRAEEHTQRLSRVYSVLSDINQVIVREKDARAMLESACRIAVEKGKFRMAWIGMIDPGTQILKPIASSGVVEGYLDGLKIDLQDPMHAGGPSARCVVSGKDAICNDIVHDPAFMPWRDEALRHGYLSSAGFPLKIDGQVAGVFNLYAGETGFFVGDELALLAEMAMDISFALEVVGREEDRGRKEQELCWRTAFFEAQVESALDGMLVVDGAGKKILQNQRLNELMKIPKDISESPDDVLQRQFVRTIVRNPDQFDQKVDYLTSHPEEVSQDVVELLDGTILERYSAPVKDKANNYYGRIWTFRDITERRRLEEQFRQAQKMEAVGQLTGGIAHDFNNLLTVILGCSEFVLREVEGNARLSKMAEMVMNAAKRGADLTHRMLVFARCQALEPKPVNVNRLLVDMESFLRRTLSAEIELQVVQGAEETVAIVDPTQLESALLNLCVNARDAMPGGGSLTLETKNVVLDSGYADQNLDVTPGQYVAVVVSDTGCGISAENQARVFDPFFTTKGVGQGTGLGLSMVYGFAKQSQGHVKIYSEVGCGTSVSLYLPKSAAATEPVSESSELIDDLGGPETILLVEDNTAVLEFAQSQLVDLGYRVLVATNGKEALQVIRENADIDLLFTDVVMPGGMNGRELAMEASRLKPELNLLYCSGYAENAIVHQGLLDKGVQLLQKPYTRLQLARMIRRALTPGRVHEGS